MLFSRFTKISAFVLIVAGGQAALAADENGRFAIKGAGLQNCGNFQNAWSGANDDLALYAGWLDGYVTAQNLHVENSYDIAPWQSVQTLMGLTQLACTQLGDDTTFMAAFDQVLRLLLPGRLTEESAVQGVSNGERTVVVYTDILIRFKTALAERGFDPGAANGDFTAQTIEAIRAFQEEQELETTGLPDQVTLVRALMQ